MLLKLYNFLCIKMRTLHRSLLGWSKQFLQDLLQSTCSRVFQSIIIYTFQLSCPFFLPSEKKSKVLSSLCVRTTVFTRPCLYSVSVHNLFWLGIGAKTPEFPNYSFLTEVPLPAQSPWSDMVTWGGIVFDKKQFILFRSGLSPTEDLCCWPVITLGRLPLEQQRAGCSFFGDFHTRMFELTYCTASECCSSQGLAPLWHCTSGAKLKLTLGVGRGMENVQRNALSVITIQNIE